MLVSRRRSYDFDVARIRCGNILYDGLSVVVGVSMMADFGAWSPFVSDGLIVFHDSHWEGVTKAICLVLKSGGFVIVDKAGSLVYLRRKGGETKK